MTRCEGSCADLLGLLCFTNRALCTFLGGFTASHRPFPTIFHFQTTKAARKFHEVHLLPPRNMKEALRIPRGRRLQSWGPPALTPLRSSGGSTCMLMLREFQACTFLELPHSMVGKWPTGVTPLRHREQHRYQVCCPPKTSSETRS